MPCLTHVEEGMSKLSRCLRILLIGGTLRTPRSENCLILQEREDTRKSFIVWRCISGWNDRIEGTSSNSWTAHKRRNRLSYNSREPCCHALNIWRRRMELTNDKTTFWGPHHVQNRWVRKCNNRHPSFFLAREPSDYLAAVKLRVYKAKRSLLPKSVQTNNSGIYRNL